MAQPTVAPLQQDLVERGRHPAGTRQTEEPLDLVLRAATTWVSHVLHASCMAPSSHSWLSRTKGGTVARPQVAIRRTASSTRRSSCWTNWRRSLTSNGIGPMAVSAIPNCYQRETSLEQSQSCSSNMWCGTAASSSSQQSFASWRHTTRLLTVPYEFANPTTGHDFGHRIAIDRAIVGVSVYDGACRGAEEPEEIVASGTVRTSASSARNPPSVCSSETARAGRPTCYPSAASTILTSPKCPAGFY